MIENEAKVKVIGTPKNSTRSVSVKESLIGKIGEVVSHAASHTPTLYVVNVDGKEYAMYEDEVAEVQTFIDKTPHSAYRYDFYLDHGDVVRWVSNNSVPFDDMLAKIEAAGMIPEGSRRKSAQQKEIDTAAFLKEYTANYTGPSDEERFEARAAFGPNVELVNVVTGKKWNTGR